MIIERLWIVLGASLLLIILLAIFNRKQLKQARTAASAAGHSCRPNAKLQLIYFWSPACYQCKENQSPVIDNLIIRLGEEKLAVTKIDISESMDQAELWGIKTVPSTCLLDTEGVVQHVNNGLATERKLIEQIEALSMSHKYIAASNVRRSSRCNR